MKRLNTKAASLTRLALAISAVAVTGSASAMSIDVGNPDFQVRFDNTIRYNIGWRVQSPEKALAKSASQHVSNNRFDKGDIVTNRVDLLTELDVVYKNDFGFRVSTQAWYDDAYKDGKLEGTPEYGAIGMPHPFGNNGHQTSTVKRYYEGPSAEILDAFVFGSFYLGDVPVRVKMGRHNLYWGESLFSFVHGVSYGQGPVDIRKATATPGIEAKETFLPLNQLSFQTQITDDVTLAGYYQLEWESARLPEGGSYFGYADFLFSGKSQLGLAPGFAIPALGNQDEPKQSGAWGLSARWNSEVLNGTVGVYYREFSDILPNPIGVYDVNGTPLAIQNAYADDVRLYGVSYSRQIGSFAVAGEILRRENTALAPQVMQPGFARGNTWHALVNAMVGLDRNALWDSAILQAEVTYSRLDKVTKDEQFYWAEGNAICTDQNGNKGDVLDGCATKDSVAIQLALTPTWYQALNGLDVSMPLVVGYGLHGSSPVSNGGNEGSGNFSVGFTFDYLATHKVDLAYNGFFGPATTTYNPVVGTNTVATSSGSIPQLRDRGWVSLTYKTSF